MVSVVVGAQWGDEGKGKIVDFLSHDYDVVVRFQGGNNAGHTIYLPDGTKKVLHIIPSGILNPNTLNIIAHGCVVCPSTFTKELSGLDVKNNLMVSSNAHIIMPYHIELDKVREKQFKIGTTLKGIGPAYEDKASRSGILIKDLFNKEILDKKLERVLVEKNALLKVLGSEKHFSLNEIKDFCESSLNQLSPFVQDTVSLLRTLKDENKRILLEGAQGTLLDLDQGDYPFVTSSNTVVSAALTGTGLNYKDIDRVYGVIKCYVTKVGEGPFPSCIEQTDPHMANRIREIGKEFGATTGRQRNIGWIDIDMLKKAVQANGIDSWVLTKSDVLNNFETIGVYEQGVYTQVPGWKDHKDHNFKQFVYLIEDLTGVSVDIVSYGTKRSETLYTTELFLDGDLQINS